MTGLSNHGPFQNQPLYPQQTVICEPLSVGDIERLAKAGVTVKFEDIAGQVRRDSEFPQQRDDRFDPYTGEVKLEAMFWARYRRAYNPHDGSLPAVQLKCIDYNDTVHVMVCTPKQAPLIIEDPKPLYPSDALMAKVALMEK